ncbi:MAG: MMPL family transporter [Lacipirellulaceae bacterium]
MLARILGTTVNRYWAALILGWLLLAGGLKLVAPSWDSIAKDGDLEYLPKTVTSLEGKRLLERAFPNERAQSQGVVVLSRGGQPLTADDRRWGLDLAETLRKADGIPLVDVWDESTKVVGDTLLAKDERAVMVVARLTAGLMDTDNARLLKLVESIVGDARKSAPEGLEVGITGSALIGGDLRSSIVESLANTELTTVILVLGCLIAIYRAPLLVLIPVATIAVSMSVSYDLVALLAERFGPERYSWSDFKVFTTTKIFVVVILFGAGTDFCLFLIARFKEELAAGTPRSEAPGQALTNVAGALAGSAFTTILGLSTMAFAQYGKFVSSGPIVGVCLFVALLACMTFAPALIRAAGSLVFWPYRQKPLDADADDAGSPFWNGVSDLVMARPVTILMVSAWLAAPLVWIGVNSKVTHDFMADLAPDRTSVLGARAISENFDAGTIAPMTVVAELAEGTSVGDADDAQPLDLRTPEGRFAIAPLHKRLFEQEGVADVRSLYSPTGGDPRKRRFLGGQAIQDLAVAGSPLAADAFVSHTEPYSGRVTQLSVRLDRDPFAKPARDLMPPMLGDLREFAKQKTIGDAPNPWFGARFELVGVTPGMRDLEVVTNSDRTLIQVLTVLAVYGVLVLLLRKPLVSLYLILTVLLGYWVTLGATTLFFEWRDGDAFRGLDWKTPIFLFVILVAVGQDYNIYLATRVLEEQKRLGLRRGLRKAMVQTGGIITSCGVIMAGTFLSMASGTLRGMIELGLALAAGVLLDTFFVRTILVPCFFAILARREKDQPSDTRGAVSVPPPTPKLAREPQAAGS